MKPLPFSFSSPRPAYERFSSQERGGSGGGGGGGGAGGGERGKIEIVHGCFGSHAANHLPSHARGESPGVANALHVAAGTPVLLHPLSLTGKRIKTGTKC